MSVADDYHGPTAEVLIVIRTYDGDGNPTDQVAAVAHEATVVLEAATDGPSVWHRGDRVSLGRSLHQFRITAPTYTIRQGSPLAPKEITHE